MTVRSPGTLAVVAAALLAACARDRGGVAKVRPALLEWQIGVTDKEGPSAMVETVLPATFEGKPVWRVVHRDPDPTRGDAASFDMVDVDRGSLAPVRSVMRREGFALSLDFRGDRVEIEKRDGDVATRFEVRVRNPMPEGPGTRVLLAGLPLRPGYATEFPVVDRWARDESHRVSNVRLTVPRRLRLQTRLGACEVFEVLLAASDGSSRSRHWVRSEPPYYPFKIEYTRADLRLVSEVTRMIVDGAAVDCTKR